MTANTERRRKQRNRPPSLLYVELEYGNGGMLRDLSEEGFAVRVKAPLRTGGKTQFAFLLDETTRIIGEGRIVWIKESGCVAGIEFCGITRKEREQIREWLGRTDPFKAQESKAPAASVSEPATQEELREEARPTLSSAALPLIESAEASHSGGADLAPVAQPHRAWTTDLAEDLKGVIPASGPEMQTEPHDVWPERSPVAAREPFGAEAAIEPLPPLQPEFEFGKTTDVRPRGRSLLRRTIGILVLLTLIASGAVYHREVGRALIWLGEIIAGEDVVRVPQSSITEPPAVATPKPETTKPTSSSTVSDGPAAPLREGDVAGSPVTQVAPGSKVIETPPSLEAAPSPATKTARVTALPPTAQRDRVLPPGSSTGTARDTGQLEYQQAEEILHNRSGVTEQAVAVRLLWSAVEKGNASAEVALAGLYRQGKGVTKNCVQTRVLLSAAARKGSAEAQKNLAELMRVGCQ